MATPASTSRLSQPAAASASGRRIAIVCRDDAAGEAATSFVAQLGLEPVISPPLRADAASLEALEVLRQADFALVLQADRPLEIGFLLGALGRSRICLLQVEGGGGIAGLPQHAIDDAGVWRLLLAREMKQAGLDVDLNLAL
ncbi:MAG TPA: hypothetical protein VFE74_05435 [Ramlibacter sp.]|nr:hypothetical protein [Ramlibacter sp.]